MCEKIWLPVYIMACVSVVLQSHRMRMLVPHCCCCSYYYCCWAPPSSEEAPTPPPGISWLLCGGIDSDLRSAAWPGGGDIEALCRNSPNV